MTPGSPPAPRVVGGALFLIGIGALATSLAIPLDQYGRWGARIFPMAASLALMVVGLIEIWSARPDTGDDLDRRSIPAILGLLLLSVAYIWLIDKFGYLIPTAFTAPAAMWLFGVRHPAGLIVAGLACPILYHMTFFVLLGVFPPLGQWFDPLDLIWGY